MANEEKESTKSFFEDIESEKVESLYFNESLIMPNYELFRINSVNGRTYFRFNEEEKPQFYIGTTSLDKEMPTSEELIEWRTKVGLNESKRRYYMRSLYGSHTHTLLSDIVRTGDIDYDGMPLKLREYFYNMQFHITEQEFTSMAIEVKKDMMAMVQWKQDCNVEFIASEFPVYSDTDGMATCIDIIAFVTVFDSVNGFKKDGITPKLTKDRVERRVLAIINYKSGKSGFRVNHRYQLEGEKNMFKERFPEFTDKDIRVFNLCAKDFVTTKWDGRTKPYSFIDQTDNIDIDRYSSYLHLAQNTGNKRLRRKMTFINGKANINDDVHQNITVKTIEDIVADGTWKIFEKSSANIPNTELLTK